MTILVVDDDEVLVDFVTNFLQDQGYTTEGVLSAIDALQILSLATRLPCLILMDVMMPQITGWDFRHRQLLDPGLAAIPVVFMSASSNDQSQAASLGADFLQKPFDLAEVLAKAQHYCGPPP